MYAFTIGIPINEVFPKIATNINEPVISFEKEKTLATNKTKMALKNSLNFIFIFTNLLSYAVKPQKNRIFKTNYFM